MSSERSAGTAERCPRPRRRGAPRRARSLHGGRPGRSPGLGSVNSQTPSGVSRTILRELPPAAPAAGDCRRVPRLLRPPGTLPDRRTAAAPPPHRRGLRRREPRSLLRHRGRRGPGKEAGPGRAAEPTVRPRARPDPATTAGPAPPAPVPGSGGSGLPRRAGAGWAGPGPAAALPAPRRGSSLCRARRGGPRPGSAQPLAPPLREHRPIAAARPRRQQPLPGRPGGGIALATAFGCQAEAAPGAAAAARPRPGPGGAAGGGQRAAPGPGRGTPACRCLGSSRGFSPGKKRPLRRGGNPGCGTGNMERQRDWGERETRDPAGGRGGLRPAAPPGDLCNKGGTAF